VPLLFALLYATKICGGGTEVRMFIFMMTPPSADF
jgi:hypothetical protein